MTYEDEVPQNEHAEQCVLGAIMVAGSSREAMATAAKILEARHFYQPATETLYGVMLDVFRAGHELSLPRVVDELRAQDKLDAVGGVDAVVGHMEAVPNSAQIEDYARLVYDAALRRFVYTETQALHARSLKPSGTHGADIVQEAASLALRAAQQRSGGDQSYRPLPPQVRNALTAITDPWNDAEGARVPTGFRELDDWLHDGLAPAGFYVIAARPSMGKSTFAMNVAENLAASGKRVFFATVETRASELLQNMIYSRANVQAGLRGDDVNDENLERLTRAASDIASMDLHVSDGPQSLLDIRVNAMLCAATGGIDLLIVDYLQLIAPDPTRRYTSRQQEVSDLSAGLKALAYELRCPVLVVSQLNRSVEQRENRRPRMSDLRESGTIEQDADAVFLLYREDYYAVPEGEAPTGEAELIVAKNRRGKTGTIRMMFFQHRLRFGPRLAHSWAQTAPEIL